MALEALRGELAAARLAARHGIHQTIAGDWTRQAMAGLTAAFSGKAAAAHLGQRELAAFVVELLEAVEAVARVAEHLAGLAGIAELAGEFEQPDLGAKIFCSCVISWFSAPPTGSILREPTQTVRSSLSHRTRLAA